jgi:UDP-N-acetylmuramyl pentapeptide phosphotransferase/UDP-N-acetylglucosamine-1-phosphate transferase
MLFYLYFSIIILSFFLTYLIRIIALKKNVIDIPNERSSHTSPTPRGGGLAIVICWFLGLTILFFLDQIEDKLYYALISGVLLAAVSLLDDILSLTPVVRLLVQAITAFAALFFLEGFNLLDTNNILLTIFLWIVSFAGIIWFINLYNFLDGIDSYASLEAIFITFSLYLFIGNPILLVLIVSILGFLYWNLPKAKIFLGDVGSTQLGFILVVLSIYFHNKAEFNFIYWLMLSSLFWFDATLTLLRRWKNEESLSLPHRKHGYQRIVQAGFSHLKTNIWAISLNLIILFFIWISKYYQISPVYPFICNIALLFIINWRIDKKFPFPK